MNRILRTGIDVRLNKLLVALSAVTLLFLLLMAALAEALTIEAESPGTVGIEIVEQFKALYEINPDIVGWLHYGDAIDLPVVYRDNSFYLEHDFHGESNASGAVFADVKSAPWADYPLTILYGHNMKNGSMFASLVNCRKLEHFKSFPILEYHSANREAPTKYVPFALLDASMTKEDPTYFFLRRFSAYSEGDTDAIQAYLDEIRERSYFEVPVDVAVGDELMLLVTCSYSNDNGRLILFTRALREGEAVEDVTALIQQSTKK